MSKFRKKPLVIDAEQFTGDSEASARLVVLCEGHDVRAHWPDGGEGYLSIRTLEGVMRAALGDWIIKGVANEIYPCKPAIFDATYELVAKVGP